MKLDNLEAVRFKQLPEALLVRMSTELYELLGQYRARREATGFIRLATRLLLGLTSEDDRLMESAVDHIMVSIESMSDLEKFTKELLNVARKLNERANEQSR